MALNERVLAYSAWVGQTNYLGWTRTLRMDLETGTTCYIGFPQVRPAQWLTVGTGFIDLMMTADQYDDVYHLLQTERPAFVTAGNFFGLQIGAVHTQLDLSRGEPTGEGYRDHSLEALVVRALAESDQPAANG